MQTTERRARYKAGVQAEILGAAREIVVHGGYENFSMRALAERIGYSTAATYKHFKSKGEIFELLADESFASLMAASESVKSIAAEDPVDRLKRGMLAYVHFGLQNPDHYRIAFLLHQPGTTPPPKPTAAYAGLKRRVLSCVDTGKFRSGDIELMAQSLWAAAHGITSLLIQKPAFPWVARRRLIAQVIDSAVKGLLAQGQRRNARRARNGNHNVRGQHQEESV
jgi:AcrR family transcriptional regulator